MPKASIVIPTHQHLEDLLKPCCASIIKYTDMADIEVIVVANGCGEDGTKQYVESLGEPFKLIWIDEGMGYTKSTNIGIKAATGNFVILLNNDVEFLPQPKNQWIELLLEPFADDKVGITGPMQVPCIHTGRDFLIFFCVCIRKSMFDKIGVLDEVFSPGYGEDSITGETPVVIKENGQIEFVPIQDLYCATKDGKCPINKAVLTKGGFKRANFIVKHTVNKPIVRTRTQTGIITTTDDHSLFMHGKEVRPRNLQCGDKIDLVNIPTVNSHSHISDAWFMGLFTAEGSASIHTYRRRDSRHGHAYWGTASNVKISMQNQAIIAKISQNRGWGTYEGQPDKRTGHTMFTAFLKSKNLKTEALAWREKYYTKLGDKKVPTEILNANRETAQQFLNGFLVGDGHVVKRKHRRDTVMLTTSSQTLAMGLMYLLQKTGKRYTVSTRKDKKNAFNIKILNGRMNGKFRGGQRRHRFCAPKLDDGSIREIIDVTRYYVKEAVYDINTDDGTFVAGMGGVLAHNTDWCCRLQDAGYKIHQVCPKNTALVPDPYGTKKLMAGQYPIWHKGNQTFKLVEGNNNIIAKNSRILSDKYGSAKDKERAHVYLCFSFNNELDILEMKFAELFDVVDRFVISEGNKTFGGKPKPYYFKDNLARFQKYLSKVSHVMVDDWPDLNPWSMERYQRDATHRALSQCRDHDIIIITDADEIPNADAVKNYKIENGLQAFEMDLYYYNMQTKSPEKWTHSKIMPYALLRQHNFWEIIYGHKFGIPYTMIPNGGQHLCYFGDVNGIIKKIEDGAHQELNTPEIKDPARIQRAIDGGRDLFGRDEITFTKTRLQYNLGCGTDYKEGFVNVDLYAPRVDVRWNLEQDWKFAADNSADLVYASNIFEHLPNKIHTMNELYRILKVGGTAEIHIPSTDGRGAFQDPQHVSFWNTNSWIYWCNDNPQLLKQNQDGGFRGNFQLRSLQETEEPFKIIMMRVILEKLAL